jgi:hypothetical protein
MIIEYQTVVARLARCPCLALVMVALGLLVLTPGRAWALGEGVTGYLTPNANPPADQTFSGGEGPFTTGGIGPSFVTDLSAPTFSSDGMDPQASSAAQPSSTINSDPLPVEDQKQRLKVNPVTGMAVASESNYSPLTGPERWKLYFKMNYWSVGAYFSPFMTTLLLDQTTGNPPGWGGGFPGFGRRLASRVGNAVLQGTFQAPVAAALHEDVRYISSSQHSFKRRAVHAIFYSFLTYNRQGLPTLNVANLGAYYLSTAVSTAWLPGIKNAARYTLSNATEQIGLSFPTNFVQEFWPEFRRHVLRQH